MHFAIDLVDICKQLRSWFSQTFSFLPQTKAENAMTNSGYVEAHHKLSQGSLAQTIDSVSYTFVFLADRVMCTLLPIWVALWFLGPSIKVH